jgi:hypothetical protein
VNLSKLGGKGMRKFTGTLIVLVLIAFSLLAVQAQTTGSIAGTIVDQTGATNYLKL